MRQIHFMRFGFPYLRDWAREYLQSGGLVEQFGVFFSQYVTQLESALGSTWLLRSGSSA
jgi:hypothetical protein